MHTKFLELLCDPATKEALILDDELMNGDDVIEGCLVSPTNTYPIRNGIPRFVDSEGYSSNFGYQWNKWSKIQFESENVGRPMEGHTKKMFKKITEIDESDIKNKLILDIGARPGRFADVALSMGATVIAIDYSSSVEACNLNFKGKTSSLLIIQGDALNLPLKDGIFDHAYSIGVLHHTPNPFQGCEEAYRVIKQDGSFSLAVYGKGGYYDFPSVQMWRKIFQVLWPLFKHWPPLIYTILSVYTIWPIARFSRFLSLPLRLVFPIANLPDLKWSILDTFDSITPSYQSAHRSYEVWSWFKSIKFKFIKPTDWSFTSYKGIK